MSERQLERLSVDEKAIPDELKKLPQWVTWKLEERNSKPSKVPYQAKFPNKRARSDDKQTWGSFTDALYAHRSGKADGIGFMLSDGDPFCGIDLDKCIDPHTGEMEDWAKDIVENIAGYIEFSPSKTGVHIITKAGLSGLKGRRKGRIELYDCGRYFTVTGEGIKMTPSPIPDQQIQLNSLHKRVFGRLESDMEQSQRHTQTYNALNDTELLKRIQRSKQGAKFTPLWSGDTTGYESHSEADLALCSILSFWTGGNAERMDVLFRQSGLIRQKWDERHASDGTTYGEATIRRALENGIKSDQNGTNAQQGDSGDGSDRKNDRPSQDELLIKLALEKVEELFRTPEGDAYATVPIGNHFEHHELRARGFRSLLQRWFYERYEKPVGSQALQNAVGNLEAKAQFDGEERQVHVRLAEKNGRIYLDLADDEWRVVEVNTQGWHILSRSPVVFRRPKALAPLTEPQQGGSLDELATFTNLSNEDWVLLLAFLVSCLNPQGPFPVLVLTAEQGSGKSTQAKVIKSLVDPNTAPLRSEPHDTRDLMIAATHSWLLAFDNLSRIPPDMSDALCRLSTGGGFATRTLYQNDEETIFNAMRPVILTGIEELTTRPDLLDRAIIINLPRITEERRMTEREFWAMFEVKQPFILGALLDAVSSGLRKLPQVKLTETPRMADLATWATACEEGLGLEPGAFMKAYGENRSNANDLALDVSPLPTALQSFLEMQRPDSEETRTWEGTATELLECLNTRVNDNTSRLRAWPKSASILGGALKRLAPNLREAGFGVEFVRSNRQRIVRISLQPGVTPVTAVTEAREDQSESRLSKVTPDMTPLEEGPSPSSPLREASSTHDDEPPRSSTPPFVEYDL